MSSRLTAYADEQAVVPHLLSGERILWLGKPDPAKWFAPADRLLVPFSLVWGGFALFWEASVIVAATRGVDGTLFFVLFGVPFVLVGVYFVFGRFLYKRWRKKRTTYAVTNRRVLSIVTGRSGDEMSAAFVSDLPAINTRVADDGSGTVTFGSHAPGQSLYANSGLDVIGWGRAGGGPVSFFDIADAQQVADLVSRQRDDELRARES